MRRTLVVAVGALALVPLLAALVMLERVPAPTVAAVASGPVGVGALGRVEPASRVRKLTHGGGPEGARVARLLVEQGAVVTGGQVLAEFHDLPKKQAAADQAVANAALAEAKLARILAAGRDTDIAAARAHIAASRAAEENARREGDRAQRLVRTGAGSEATFDKARFAAEQAVAERARAEAELRSLLAPRAEDVTVATAERDAFRAAAAAALAERDLARLVAPIGGTVLKIHAREGEKVPDGGVLELADLTALEVVAEVYETDLPRVRVGAMAEITVPGETATFAATVTQIGWMVGRQSVVSTDPVASVDARVIEVRLRLDEAGAAALRRRSNMQVQVAIRP